MTDPIRNAIETVLDTAPPAPERRPAVSPSASRTGDRNVKLLVACATVLMVGIAGLMSVVWPDSSEPSDRLATQPGPASTEPSPTPSSPTTSTQQPETSISVPPTQVDVDESGRDRFADIFVQLVNTSNTANEAVSKQTHRCMQDAGHEYEPLERAALDASQLDTIQRPWTRENIPDENGYSQSFRLPATVPAPNLVRGPEFDQALFGDEMGRWSITVDEQFTSSQALDGQIRDGCYPQAVTDIIGGGDPSQASLIIDIGNYLQGVELEARRGVTSNPELLGLVPDWADCMATAGYEFTRLNEPSAEFNASEGTSQREQNVSSADRECLTSTGIADLGDRLFEDEISQRLDEDAALLQTLTGRLDAIAQRTEAE